MYISQIKINNFRCFKDTVVKVNDGINVIIGHNNAGKSNLLRALSLIFNQNGSKKLTTDDFNKDVTFEQLREGPPKVFISTILTESDEESDDSDDLVTVSSWLTKLEKPYEAKLTYEFFLPEIELKNYSSAIGAIDSDNIDDFWRVIEHEFIRKYTYRIYGGPPELKNTAESEFLNKFDFQYLDAIRDVERDLFTGRNTLLREVLDFFMDFDIKKDPNKKPEEKAAEIKAKRKQFSEKAIQLIDELKTRILDGKKEMLRYAHETGASFGNALPDFEGHILDSELFSALKLIVELETGIKIPASHNGLGYNNLMYISLLLAKMQRDTAVNYLGSNAKVFPMLIIEEPEAHLHPSMQYKFLKFLKENKQKEVRQIFITTHSPNITSAVDLDEIICLNKSQDGILNIGYPGKVFSSSVEDQKSKAYIKRFLDATKSDMLFAKGVILVEGIAEQLMMPVFAKYLARDCEESKDLEDSHITVISVGGRYFGHFLKLFDLKRKCSLHKKVACITDLDPSYKKRDDSLFTKCYPFELNVDTEKYDYKPFSNDLIDKCCHPSESETSNICVFTQKKGKGKTFEYELILHNPSCNLLITDSMSNKEEISQLMQLFNEGKEVHELIGSLGKSSACARIKNIVQVSSTSWSEEEKKKHIIAARYLDSVGKGENALELAQTLKEHLLSEEKSFIVPPYIKEAIEWVCQ